MIRTLEVREGTYHDSVSLMVVSRTVGDVDGVRVALVAMATELNLSLLDDLGFDLATLADVSVNDLLIAIEAEDESALATAQAAAEAALAASSTPAHGSGSGGDAPPPRTIAGAVRQNAESPEPANLALVSVPGPHAFAEAMDALRAGLHVMVFSDNVTVDHEVALKQEGLRRGLLVMGPDCGTAIVGGVGLGFANVVRPGPVGIVAASGTGAQQLCCLLDDADIGLTHVLGVGSRDLSEHVAAAATGQALAALDADPATEIIVVLSKPPAAAVADQVRELARGCRTPTVLAFLGRGGDDLTATATQVAKVVGRPLGEPASWAGRDSGGGRRSSHLRGLFVGGTLCDEAMMIAADELGPIASNIPLEEEWALPDQPGANLGLGHDGHVMIDFGDDRLTRGRPHPMIDNRLRVERIDAEATDASTGVLLLDVVLGHGAHADPAADLAPALAQAIATADADGRELSVVVSLCGSRSDPQGRDRQAAALSEAGAWVHLSNAAAARRAVALVKETS